MYYINSRPTENGNYGNPQSNARADALALPDELLSAYLDTMGFAILTVEDKPVADDEGNEIGAVPTVTAVAVNQEAYDAYQEAHPPQPEPEPEPEDATTIKDLEDAMCEMDAANEARFAAIEDALCELDKQ